MLTNIHARCPSYESGQLPKLLFFKQAVYNDATTVNDLSEYEINYNRDCLIIWANDRLSMQDKFLGLNLDQTKEKDKCKRVINELGFNVHMLHGHVPLHAAKEKIKNLVQNQKDKDMFGKGSLHL